VLSGGEEKQVVFDLIPYSSSPKTVSNSNPYFVPLAGKQYRVEDWYEYFGIMEIAPITRKSMLFETTHLYPLLPASVRPSANPSPTLQQDCSQTLRQE
jgi:hypothetical protein